MKADPSRDVVYLVDANYNRLLAIDTASGKQINWAPIDDGMTKGEIAISVDDTKLYLAEYNENEILVFSLPNLTPLPTVPLAFSPTSIAAGVDGRLFAVDGDEDDFLTELNPADGSILNYFGFGFISPLLRTNASGTHLYVTDTTVSGEGDFDIYNLAHGQEAFLNSYDYLVNDLADFVPDETHNRIFYANDILGVIQTTTNTDTQWPLYKDEIYGCAAVSCNPSGNVVFAAIGNFPFYYDIRRYDGATGEVSGDWPVQTASNYLPYHCLAATGNGCAVYFTVNNNTQTETLGLISAVAHPIVLTPTLAQTVTFTSLSGSDTAGGSLTLQATSSSGFPVTYTVVSGPAKISGDVITFTGVGTAVVAATAGNAVFKPSTATQTIMVSKGNQTISPFTLIPNHTYGDKPFSFTPPVSSAGLPIVVTVQSGPAKIVRNVVTITGAGAVTLAANQPGNANYTAAAEVTTSFAVDPASQTIAAFKTIPTKASGAAPFTVTPPAASSKLPVTLSVLSGPATAVGDKVTVNGPGTVVLAANQPGDADYNAAPQVTTSFLVR